MRSTLSVVIFLVESLRRYQMSAEYSRLFLTVRSAKNKPRYLDDVGQQTKLNIRRKPWLRVRSGMQWSLSAIFILG